MMTNLLSHESLSMTSLEISELVGSRHDNVKVSVDRLVASGVIRAPATQVVERINNLGFSVQQDVYLFSGQQGKRDSIVVVAQLSPEFTARLVDRWQELEARQAPPAPDRAALQLATQSTQRKAYRVVGFSLAA